MKRVLGAAVFILGLELAGWVGYNLLIERSPHTRNLPLLPCIILSPVCLYVGYKWMRGRGVWPASGPRGSDIQSPAYPLWMSRGARFLKYLFSGPIARLAADDPDKVQRAKRALLKHDFLKMDLPLLYEAIRKPWPDDGDEASSTRGLLLRCLWKTHKAGTVDFIRDVFPTLPANRDIRFAALLTLGMMNTSESLTAMMDLLERYKTDLGRYIGPLFRRQYETHEHPEVIFPRLVLVMPSLEYRHEAYRLAISYRDHSKVIVPHGEAVDTGAGNAGPGQSIDGSIQSGFGRQILDDFQAAMAMRAGLDKDSDDYGDNVEILCTLLNSMGSLKADAGAMAILRRTLEDESPWVALHAARSLLRLGQEVPVAAINRIATFGVTRPALPEALKQAGRRDDDALPQAVYVPSYPPPSPEIEICSKNADMEFIFRLSLRAQTVVRLIRELPPRMSLVFYDPEYPSTSDPGAYFSVVRHVDGYSIGFWNRFWSTHSWWIDEGTLIRYIWGCRFSHIRNINRRFPASEERILLLGDEHEDESCPVVPVDNAPSKEFAIRLFFMPLSI